MAILRNAPMQAELLDFCTLNLRFLVNQKGEIGILCTQIKRLGALSSIVNLHTHCFLFTPVFFHISSPYSTTLNLHNFCPS